MNEKKLGWDAIKRLYDQEWVELVEYDWPDGTLYPLAGVVRTHASDKKEFYRMCGEGEVPPDSALLFVGRKKSLEGTVFSPSLIRVDQCGK